MAESRAEDFCAEGVAKRGKTAVYPVRGAHATQGNLKAPISYCCGWELFPKLRLFPRISHRNRTLHVKCLYKPSYVQNARIDARFENKVNSGK